MVDHLLSAVTGLMEDLVFLLEVVPPAEEELLYYMQEISLILELFKLQEVLEEQVRFLMVEQEEQALLPHLLK